MKTRSAVSGACLLALGVLALVGWRDEARPRPEPLQQSRGGGSEAPCAVPLAWRVTRVDREFGIDIPRATQIVRTATALWQTAAGQPLFEYDDAEGFPIRLVYDERQERTQERVRRQAEVEALGSGIDTARAALVARVEAHEEAVSAHAERQRDYERRLAEHNAVVRGWNERGGAPPEVGADLGAAVDSLAAERQRLEALSRPLERAARELEDAGERLNRDIGEHARRAAQLARDFPRRPWSRANTARRSSASAGGSSGSAERSAFTGSPTKTSFAWWRLMSSATPWGSVTCRRGMP